MTARCWSVFSSLSLAENLVFFVLAGGLAGGHRGGAGFLLSVISVVFACSAVLILGRAITSADISASKF